MPRPVIRASVDGKCRVCGSTEFGTRNRCKPCNRKKRREERAKDVEKIRAQDAARSRRWRRANPDKMRAQDLREQYGLSVHDYAAMLLAQNKACPICQRPDPDCVDHCHVTGRVRGIVCRLCNIGMGQFRDDPSLLLAAADYVEEHERTRHE